MSEYYNPKRINNIFNPVSGDEIPEAGDGCDYCAYVSAVNEFH